MKFRSIFPKYLLISLLCLNAYCVYRFSRFVVVVDSYRAEVRHIAADMAGIATNFLANSVSSQTSFSSTEMLCSDEPVFGGASIPYRYSVVRGVPGLTSGGLSWYPVGSAMPYGILSSCSRDFACFNGLDWYSLGHE